MTYNSPSDYDQPPRRLMSVEVKPFPASPWGVLGEDWVPPPPPPEKPLHRLFRLIQPGTLSTIIDRVERGVISYNEGKQILREIQSVVLNHDGWMATPDTVDRLIAFYGFLPVVTEGVEEACAKVVEQFPDKVTDYKFGNTKVINWLLGQVMKLGKYNAKDVSATLLKLLSQPES